MPAIRRIQGWLLLLWLLLLFGCGGPELSPEQRVRELIARGEAAAEERSIGFFADHVADGYQGRDGSGKREVIRLLRGYFLRHQAIHLLVKVESVRSEGGRLRALVYAGMAGSPVQGFEQLLAMRAGLYRFDLEFTAGDEPQLMSANWRRADVEEVLPEL